MENKENISLEVNTENLMSKKDDPSLLFQLESGFNAWFMKIVKRDGIVKIEFNHERYPDLFPDDFARNFGDIISKNGFLDQFYDKKARKPLALALGC
jgi:hypothetical protein